jgi:hypothetical protein
MSDEVYELQHSLRAIFDSGRDNLVAFFKFRRPKLLLGVHHIAQSSSEIC